MFALVDNVEEYENFLPWCGGTEIIEKSENITKASIKLIITASSKPSPQKTTKPFLQRMVIKLITWSIQRIKW